MGLDELMHVLGREYRFKPSHSREFIEFLSNTQTIADMNFHLSYNICRASGEKYVLNQLSFNELEKILRFYGETLTRITLNGHEVGYRRAASIHQNFANAYSKIFDIDGDITRLEKAIEHSLKSTEYVETEAHKSYTFGFIGEFSRKIFQKTKEVNDLPWAEKAIEFYKKSRDLSENPSHKANCASYMADVMRDAYQITSAVYFADEAINYYLNSAEEFKKIKPEQAFHNLSHAGDVAFSVFSKIENPEYLKKSHALYHMALREQKEEKHEGSVRINILRSACKLYKRLHEPSFVQEAFYQAALAIQTKLKPRSESYIIAKMSELCIKLPSDFIILPDQFQKLVPFAQKFPGDHRSHILLSSFYRNKLTQTKEQKYAELTLSSLEKSVEFAFESSQKALNCAWAGRTSYSLYMITKNPEHLKKAYEYHEKASEIIPKSYFLSGLCAQELYRNTKEEQWKNKAIDKYTQFLNSSPSEDSKTKNAKEHIQELTE